MPILLLAVMVVPTAIIVGIEIAMQLDKPAVIPVDFLFLLQPVIALYLASQAPQLFSRDLRYRSIVLYLARPPRRTDYAFAKLIALVLAQMVLIGLPLFILYVGALLAKYNFADMSKEFLAGLVAALLLSILLAALGGLIAAATPRRGFAVAAIIAVLMVSFTAVVTTSAILDSDGNMTSVAARFANLASPFSLGRARCSGSSCTRWRLAADDRAGAGVRGRLRGAGRAAASGASTRGTRRWPADERDPGSRRSPAGTGTSSRSTT